MMRRHSGVACRSAIAGATAPLFSSSSRCGGGGNDDAYNDSNMWSRGYHASHQQCRAFHFVATATRLQAAGVGGNGVRGSPSPSMVKQAMSMMSDTGLSSAPSLGPADFRSSSGPNELLGQQGGDGAEGDAKPGHSDEDAYGEVDPLMAIERVAQRQRQAQVAANADGAIQNPEQRSADDAETEDTNAKPAAGATKKAEAVSREADIASVAGAAASEAIISQTTKSQRHRRRRRNVDTILGDVLHDALKLRDMGHKPTADFVYKRSQERLYEEEYGHKPPSAKEHAMKYIPFPPDWHLHRLLPLERNLGAADGEEETLENTRLYSKNYMHTYRFLPEDPWPERAITVANPVWSKRMVEEDKQKTDGQGIKDWEARMYKPRAGYDVVGEFCDAMDELAYWEARLLTFLRDVPLSQRRSLPYLHEFYRTFVHRVIRAEKRYIETRNAVLVVSFKPAASSTAADQQHREDVEGDGGRGGAKKKTVQETIEGEKRTTATSSSTLRGEEAAAAGRTPRGKSFFNRTEEVVERIRSVYAEAHRSLSSPTYDPLRMKKSALSPFMRMTKEEFIEWQAVQKQRRNALVAELS